MRLARMTALLLMGLAFLVAANFAAGPKDDPLPAEIARWSAFVHAAGKEGDPAQQGKQAALPLIERAEKALQERRRLLAIQRLAAAYPTLGAAQYTASRPAAEHKDQAQFEAEWKRMGKVLRDDIRPVAPDAFAHIKPAAVRGLAEASQASVKVFYDASLDYSRSTDADAGLFYVGSAVGARQFVSLARKLSTAETQSAPVLRSLTSDIEELQGELLAAYKPPASIDRHAEFIVGNSALKEARELDAAGLRYGALMRYLQAALRTAPLRPQAKLDAAALTAKLRDLETRLGDAKVDHSIGRTFLESAQSEVDAAPGTAPPNAIAIATDVLPRYFAALAPAKPAPPRQAASVVVTLVRWPYT